MKIIELIEAFEVKRKEKGEVPFKKSALTDPHIVAIINRISAETGVPADTIRDELAQSPTIAYAAEAKKYSPILFDTMAENVVESAAFKHIQDSIRLQKIKFADVAFDWRIFNKLCRLIELEHTPPPGSPPGTRGLFPLIPAGELRRINKILPIFVPNTSDPAMKEFNSVTTAAVYSTGEFVFNTEFMQNLLNYGAAIDVKPSGKKYVANGGTIPNEYCYIEFLILHEIFHYIFADFTTGSKYKQYHPSALNWAMDLRSNYLLVKSGYEQLPMGLFSDDVNLDRIETSTFEKLIQVVDSEMKKLPEELQQWIDKEQSADDHPPNDSSNEEEEEDELKVGDEVVNHETGEVSIITKLYPDGSAEVSDPIRIDKSKIKGSV